MRGISDSQHRGAVALACEAHNLKV
ncbi:hypothetical protein KIPB_013364, partial [Kipferlia bialata]|eukprot:g13364.t1